MKTALNTRSRKLTFVIVFALLVVAIVFGTLAFVNQHANAEHDRVSLCREVQRTRVAVVAFGTATVNVLILAKQQADALPATSPRRQAADRFYTTVLTPLRQALDSLSHLDCGG